MLADTQLKAAAGTRVLLIEDQPFVRGAIKLLLEQDKHTVIEAEDGLAAWAVFERERFDVVIVDYDLPGLMGDQLASRIKQVAPAQPVVMITVYGYEVRSLEGIVDAVLEKPFGMEELRRTIAGLLCKRARQGEIDSVTA